MLALATFLNVAPTREALIRIDLAKPTGTAPESIYGQFLEHIYKSVVGGLHAEMLEGGSFEEPPAVAIPGAAVENGVWTVEVGEIRQTSLEPDAHLWFEVGQYLQDGSFSLEARKEGGDEGFLIIFRARDQDNFLWWNLGGWGNTFSAVERETNGQRTILAETRTDATIFPGHWYQIRIDMHANWTFGFLDGRRLFALSAPEGFGRWVGVGTWQTRASFRNLHLQRLRDARILWHADTEAGQGRAVSRTWEPYSTGEAESAYQWEASAAAGERCQMIALRRHESGEHGIRQKGIPITAGERYACSLYIKGKWLADPVVVSLSTPWGQKHEVTLCQIGPHWQRRCLLLTAPETTTQAVLSIGLRGPGAIWLDGLSLMPAELPEAMPLREDLYQAVKALRPAFIRWPGGCFAERYHWRDGVGPPQKRIPRPNYTWGGIDPNTFGTDEFVALCRALGAEPVVCLNIGQHEAPDRLDAYLAEALDWIEYSNAEASTPLSLIHI